MTSDLAINLHHEQMASDAQYAADYEESRRIDEALEAAWFAREIENEKFVDWFADNRIDYTGYEEIDVPETFHLVVGDNIPF